MKIQCVILVVCAAICASASPFEPRCSCLKTLKAVDPKKVFSVAIKDPTPYCNRKEVIITLKDNKAQVCLEPEGQFFKRLEQQMTKMTAENKSTKTSTTATPASAFTAFVKTL